MTNLAAWIAEAFDAVPVDLALYERALTHGSKAADTYERLEFLGDRVLGLVMAQWLFESFPTESEGALSKRFNTLVTGAACAEVAREIGVATYLRLGKQARDDGASDSDYVLGDVMEALLGALYLDHGMASAQGVVRRLWATRIHAAIAVPQHPKSELLEWSAANRRKPPLYEILDRRGPDHAPRYTVRVAIPNLADATAEGRSKQEAERTAAQTLLARLTGIAP